MKNVTPLQGIRPLGEVYGKYLIRDARKGIQGKHSRILALDALHHQLNWSQCTQYIDVLLFGFVHVIIADTFVERFIEFVLVDELDAPFQGLQHLRTIILVY